MKKLFIPEEKFNDVVWMLREKGIAYSTDMFQFDVKTAVVIFIVTSILAVIVL